MAVEFTHDGDSIRLNQTRAGFRITAVVFAGFWLLGAAIITFQSLHETPTTLVCDHALARCTLTEGRHVTELPLTELVAVSLQTTHNVASARLERSGAPHVHSFCRSTPGAGASAPAKAVVDALEAFRADPSHPPIRGECIDHPVGGVNLPVVLGASLGGWLLVLLITFQFSMETHVVFDRRAGKITARGRCWFRPSWSIERPLTDITRIACTSLSAGRGQRQYIVRAAFTDETSVLLWTPAAVRLTTLEQRVAAMRVFLGLPPDDAASA